MISPSENEPPASIPFIVCTVVLAATGLVSRFLSEQIAATIIPLIFLAATWFMVLRHDDEWIERHGLLLGGVMARSRPLRIVDGLVAVGCGLALSALVTVPFILGYISWWYPARPFDAHVIGPLLRHDAVGQLVMVALPEEAFFRGYLQTALDRVWRGRISIFGAPIGLSLLATSAVFAVGHLLTIPHPARLLVFFPALVFGWLRARTGGIGAAILFHAYCNLLSSTLAHGFGLS